MKEIQFAVLALGLTGFCFSILLAFLSKKLKVEENPKVEKVLDILPGLNCGACGFSGCLAYAQAAVKKCNIFQGCLPGGNEVNEKISQVLGAEGCVPSNKQIVICSCGAQGSEKKSSSTYLGPQTCKAADLIGGEIDCIYGCMGLRDCIEACPVNALSLSNKKIYVDIEKCIGCGKCVKECPRKLFGLVTLNKEIGTYFAACSNKEKALGVKTVCSRGCIACTLCTKVKDSPYYMKNNLSYINQQKATHKKPLEEGKNECPTKCIYEIASKESDKVLKN